MKSRIAPVLVALALAAVALLMVAGSLGEPVRWTPDGLFYQARALELGDGADRQAALAETFGGPLGAELRRVDPQRAGDPAWVAHHARFYERRVALPLAASVLGGDRALLRLSVAGYVLAVLALFALLLLRFRLAIAAAVALATAALPALTHHAGLPLTDTWGLALQTAALACGLLALDRGRRWLVPWAAAILVLSFTRDSVWIPVLAAAWVAVSQRRRIAWELLATGVLAALPVLALFSVPTRELLATMLNTAQPAPDASWGFIAERYPGALVDLLQADGGFVRDGAWYSAAYLAAGLAALFALARGSAGALLRAGALAGVASVLAVPIFSAFRLELVLVPMAAFGLALAAERVAERAAVPAWARAAPIGRTDP